MRTPHTFAVFFLSSSEAVFLNQSLTDWPDLAILLIIFPKHLSALVSIDQYLLRTHVGFKQILHRRASSTCYHNPRKRSTEELLSDAPQKGSMVVPNSQLATGQRAGGQQGNLNVQRERIRANPKPYQVAEGPGGS
eukprot:scaffold167460_cov26-Tisochrysis_lutea.AAC.1